MFKTLLLLCAAAALVALGSTSGNAQSRAKPLCQQGTPPMDDKDLRALPVFPDVATELKKLRARLADLRTPYVTALPSRDRPLKSKKKQDEPRPSAANNVDCSAGKVDGARR